MAHRVKPESERPAGPKYMVYAEDLKKLRQIKRFLCSMTAPAGRYRPTDEQIADTCRGCSSQCAYGRRFAELVKQQKEAGNMAAAKKAADELTMQEQLEQKIKECRSLTVRLEQQEKKAKELAEALLQKEEENKDLSGQISQLSTGLVELSRKNEIAEQRERESGQEIAALALQILKLKAAVYDLEHDDI